LDMDLKKTYKVELRALGPLESFPVLLKVYPIALASESRQTHSLGMSHVSSWADKNWNH
jgi:hypothetical protein